MKNFLPYLPVALLAFTLVGGWFNLQADTKTTKAKVEEIKIKVEELEDEGAKKLEKLKDSNKELDKKIDINQTKQEEIDKKVEQINIKTDKIVELLLDMKSKKK